MPSRSNSAWLSSRSNSAREEMAAVSGGRVSDGMRGVWTDPVAAGETRPPPAGSGRELLAEDPLLQVVLGVEEQGHRAVARLLDGDLDHVADLVRIGGGADRPLV